MILEPAINLTPTLSAAMRCRAAVARGLAFLQNLYPLYGFQSFVSQTADMRTPASSPHVLYPGLTEFPLEIFTTMLITDLIFKQGAGLELRSGLLHALQQAHVDGIFQFFDNKTLLPPDVDCTSIGLSILIETGRVHLDIVNDVVNKILSNIDREGVIQVYFPPYGHRQYVDPVVCVNALYLAALLDRQEEACKTESFVLRFLSTREYLQGTRYYPSPEAFLYFLVRLSGRFGFYREKLSGMLGQELTARIDAPGNALELAMRLLIARQTGLANDAGVENLLNLQSDDGSWPAAAFFRFGRGHAFFGSKALTTAFAVAALKDKS